MVGCIWAKVDSAAEINEGKAEIKRAVERDSWLAGLDIQVQTTLRIMIPQDIFTMDVLWIHQCH